MAKGQVSVARTGKMAEALAEAYKTFDEAETDGEAFKCLAIDWLRNRDKNSKRGALERIEKSNERLEKNVAYLIAIQEQLSARIAALEENEKHICKFKIETE